ncbi:hypothetical protein ACRAWF_23565, partial [Streptomyces sp. L7]
PPGSRRPARTPSPERRTTPWHRLFLRSLRDPFTAVLLCLGLVSALVASWGTAAVILALVAVSCVLRAGGEHRADRSLHELRELVGSTACVLRRTEAGAPVRAREIPVAELVPGDVVRLGPGDLVPADLRTAARERADRAPGRADRRVRAGRQGRR